jgi:hypothetical protein
MAMRQLHLTVLQMKTLAMMTKIDGLFEGLSWRANPCKKGRILPMATASMVRLDRGRKRKLLMIRLH